MNVDITKKRVIEEKRYTGHLNTAGGQPAWKIVVIGMSYLVIFICICMCIYFTIKH
ncbi:unnamed protein product [Schistosoma spindalis]|nr:unnamed protein product [Schistosoma spindale]